MNTSFPVGTTVRFTWNGNIKVTGKVVEHKTFYGQDGYGVEAPGMVPGDPEGFTRIYDVWPDNYPYAYCPDCKLWGGQWVDGRHLCTVYDGPPCETCGAPTVFVTVAAPGTGSGRTCRVGHFHGTCRELTIDDVR